MDNNKDDATSTDNRSIDALKRMSAPMKFVEANEIVRESLGKRIQDKEWILEHPAKFYIKYLSIFIPIIIIVALLLYYFFEKEREIIIIVASVLVVIVILCCILKYRKDYKNADETLDDDIAKFESLKSEIADKKKDIDDIKNEQPQAINSIPDELRNSASIDRITEIYDGQGGSLYQAAIKAYQDELTIEQLESDLDDANDKISRLQREVDSLESELDSARYDHND